jgi:Mg/Co/Ni transporter MgtE
MTFEEQLLEAAKSAALKNVTAGHWIEPQYSNRVQIPKEFMHEVWAMVDKEALKRQLAVRIENELAERIVNSMAAEIATDIKQVLSVKERREALRQLARAHIESIMGEKL